MGSLPSLPATEKEPFRIVATIKQIVEKINGVFDSLVTATSAFSSDNRVLRSDGTERGAQASNVTIDDTGNVLLSSTTKLDWNSGDVIIAHSANALTMTGGSLTISIGTTTTGLTITGSGTDTQFLLSNTTAGGKAWNFLSTGTGTGQPFGAGHFQAYNGSDGITGLGVSPTGSLIAGLASGALATNATDGFLYIPTCAGAPTGVPTAYTGKCAMIFDTTNNKLYIYDGGWLGGTAPGAWT